MKRLSKFYESWQIFGVQLSVVIFLALYTGLSTSPSLIGSIYALAGVRSLVATENSSFSDEVFTRKANADFERAYAYGWVPSSLDTYRRLAQVFTVHNKSEGAISALKQAYQLWPEDLLLQQELARTYLSVGKMDAALTIWQKFGTTAERMIVVGDEYLKQYNYREALAWYNLAALDLSFLPTDLAFRRAALAIMVYKEKEVVADLVEKIQDFPIYQVNKQSTILGSELRLLSTYPEIPVMLYGKTLADGFAQTQQVPPTKAGILWRSGEAVAIFEVGSGDYLVKVQATHRGPSGAEMAIGIDGKILKVIHLDSDVTTWETITTAVTLRRGLHAVNIRFLNELTVIGGEDRKLEIAQIELDKQ